jgi:hypothetical protein
MKNVKSRRTGCPVERSEQGWRSAETITFVSETTQIMSLVETGVHDASSGRRRFQRQSLLRKAYRDRLVSTSPKISEAIPAPDPFPEPAVRIAQRRGL